VSGGPGVGRVLMVDQGFGQAQGIMQVWVVG
jgi:hypothetical protein